MLEVWELQTDFNSYIEVNKRLEEDYGPAIWLMYSKAITSWSE